MPTTYTLESRIGDRQKLVDSTGGVGAVYIKYTSSGPEVFRFRVGIVPRWNTSTVKLDSKVLFLHLDGSLVPGHLDWAHEEHDVFASMKEAEDALAKFLAAGCPGLTLENLAATKARTKAHNSSAKAKKAEGILRGMELADLVALRKAVDAAIAKKTPTKKTPMTPPVHYLCPVDTVCYLCGGLIPEGTPAVLVAVVGTRHGVCPKRNT